MGERHEPSRCRWGEDSFHGACGETRIVGRLESLDGNRSIPVCEDHTEAVFGRFVPTPDDSADP